MLVGQLAVLKEKDKPSLQWKLVHINGLHPGPDEITRVVTVQTSDGTMFKRPVSKIAVLPIDVIKSDLTVMNVEMII